MLIDTALYKELFHTPAGTAFADILVPIRSKRFRGWLRRRYYQTSGDTASTAEIRSALDLFEARAQFDGPDAPSMSALPSMPATSISISLMSTGGLSTSDQMDGT